MDKSDEQWASVVRHVLQELDKPRALLKSSSDGFEHVSRYIDHTLLKTDATGPQVDEICEEAQKHGFAAVCVRPEWVSRAANLLKQASPPIPVASVIAFHEGTAPTASKVVESLSAVAAGAKELDVVLNRNTLLGPSTEEDAAAEPQSLGYAATFAELKAIRDAVPTSSGIHLKLILETSQLSRDAIVAACVLASAAEWDYVKTSSGFCGRGASVEDVELMKACAEVIPSVLPLEDGKKAPVMKVKASGGIRTFEDAVKMVNAGASRIGASSGVAIVEQAAAAATTK